VENGHHFTVYDFVTSTAYWRDVLLTVFYARALVILYEDVCRTKPFAVLTRREDGKASSTLLQGSEAWSARNHRRTEILYFDPKDRKIRRAGAVVASQDDWQEL
jgi:hypothetical protein